MLRKVVVVVERKELVMVMVMVMAMAMEMEMVMRKEVVMVVQRMIRLIEGGATPAPHPREWFLQLAASIGRT
jgi:hypothetical protein